VQRTLKIVWENVEVRNLARNQIATEMMEKFSIMTENFE
jgi:hypothetical protein